MSYNFNIRAAVEKFLKEDDWKYSFDEDRGIIRAGVNLDGKLRSCNLIIDLRDNYYFVYAIIDIQADEACRQKVAEYITRANYGLRFGNFELDMNDGEIRYKMIVDCGDNCDRIPSKSIIERSIYIPAKMIQKYGDNLLAVMYGFMEPAEAIQKAEN